MFSWLNHTAPTSILAIFLVDFDLRAHSCLGRSMTLYVQFGLKYGRYQYARIAQLVEHTTDTGGVLGSNPSARTRKTMEVYLEIDFHSFQEYTKSMNTSLIIILVLVGLFVITFLVELVVVIILLVKTHRLKKLALKNGYSSSRITGIILPAKEQVQNFKDSIGYSLFSFNFLIITSFGKDFLPQMDNDIYKVSVENLRKIHKVYICLLFLAFFLMIAALGIGFLSGDFA
jgi:hypothetical protein